jgi:hypothetical protein
VLLLLVLRLVLRLSEVLLVWVLLLVVVLSQLRWLVLELPPPCPSLVMLSVLCPWAVQ